MNERSFNYTGRNNVATREDRKKEITRLRQEQILEAALSAFSSLGYDRATIPDIAREAGIAVGTIYNYFPSKRELLVAITKKYIIEPFTAVIKQSKSTDDNAFMAAIMENRFSFGLTNLEKFMPLLIEVQRDPELRRSYTEKVIRPVMDFMGKYVSSRIERETFRDIEPELVTRAVGGMVIGFMLLYRIEGEKSPLYGTDPQKLAFTITDLILKGLQKQ
jgi:AcrR family transcriptional regulator